MPHDLARTTLLALGCCFALAIGQLAFAPEAAADDGRIRSSLSRGTATARSTVQSPRVAAAPATPRHSRRVMRVAEPRTAMQLAAIQGLSYADMRSHVLLSGATLRVRLYPGSNVVSVSGREYRVKDHVTRSGSNVRLTSRVSRFLQARIYEARAAERQRKKAVAVTPKPKLEPLPPLPERRRAVKKTPKKEFKPASRPLPVRRTPRAAKAQPGWAPSVEERKWKWIILHHSDTEEGDMAKYDDYHRNVKRWENGCGYHFVIGNGTLSGDGEVEIGPRWEAQLQGAHAKVPGNRYNEQGVGICLVGDFDEAGGRPSADQMDALVNLLRWLSERYDIDSADIKGHCDCCSTCCPGKNFPWAELRRRLQ